jgi:hypothetical protein
MAFCLFSHVARRDYSETSPPEKKTPLQLTRARISRDATDQTLDGLSAHRSAAANNYKKKTHAGAAGGEAPPISANLERVYYFFKLQPQLFNHRNWPSKKVRKKTYQGEQFPSLCKINLV